MNAQKTKTSGEGQKLPALKTLSKEYVSEEDFVSLVNLASMNNVILKKADRGKVLRNQPFKVEKRVSVGGLTFTAIHVAEDLNEKEYGELTKAINPTYEDKPIEEILVEEGLRSLLQIKDADVKYPIKKSLVGKSVQAVKMVFRGIGINILESREQRSLRKLRTAIDRTQDLLEEVETKDSDTEKANLQARALELLQNSFTENLPHVEYKGVVLRELPTPRRTLHHMDVICEQKIIIAYSILNAIKPKASSLKANPVGVMVDYKGVGGGHTSLLCKLADGSYYLFDASIPMASGRLPENVLRKNSVPEPIRRKPILINLQQHPRDEDGFQKTRYHQQLQLLPPIDKILSVQRNNLGFVYKRQGNLEYAIRKYQEALKINPGNIEARGNLGSAYHDQGNLDEAIKQYKKALVNPRFVEVHNNLGAVYMDQDNLEEAINEFQKALKINPEFAEAYGNLGVAYHKQGKTDKAVSALENFLKYCPKDEYLEQQKTVRALIDSARKDR